MAQLLLFLIVLTGGVVLTAGPALGAAEYATWLLITVAGLVSLIAVTAVKRRRAAGGDIVSIGYCDIHDSSLYDGVCPMCRAAQEPPSTR